MKMPRTPTPLDRLIDQMQKSGRLLDVLKAQGAIPIRKDYLHWDELRYRFPPEGLSSEEWWLGVKLQRQASMQKVPLLDKQGRAFGFTIPDFVSELLHKIDLGAGMLTSIREPITNPLSRDRAACALAHSLFSAIALRASRQRIAHRGSNYI